jgi:hypothetical protein
MCIRGICNRKKPLILALCPALEILRKLKDDGRRVYPLRPARGEKVAALRHTLEAG